MKSISFLPMLLGVLLTCQYFESTKAFVIPSSAARSGASAGTGAGAGAARLKSYSRITTMSPLAPLTSSTAKFGMNGFELSDVFYDDTSMAFDAW